MGNGDGANKEASVAKTKVFHEALPPTRRDEMESFRGAGERDALTVLDFWQWSASDLLTNLQRSRLAEYLVAKALGVATGIRSEWEPYDVKSTDGITVEVKASGYVQSWRQRVPSRPTFGIGPTRRYDEQAFAYSTDARRQAEVYVFALLSEHDPKKVNPLDLDQWRFYVVSTVELDRRVPGQQTISLNRLEKLGAAAVRFSDLAAEVTRIGTAERP